MPRNLLLAALALGSAAASAQTVNTQINGIVLTNGLGSVTDSSALGTVNTSAGVAVLTDNDLSTGVFNAGHTMFVGAGTALQGNFSGTLGSGVTTIYAVQPGSIMFNPLVPSGSFSVQLVLLGGGLTSARSYSPTDFTVTDTFMPTTAAFLVNNGSVLNNPTGPDIDTFRFAYVGFAIADFSTTYDQVIGIRFSNFTAEYPDFFYIGAGYAGTYSGGGGAPVPEPSTYGLALGGLALAVVAARRRKISK